MRILIHDYAGHPFQVQLSRELASRGYEVLHLYAGYNQTPRGALAPRAEDPPSLGIGAVFIRSPLDKDSYIKRWLQEREYGRHLAVRAREFSPDVVISANTPLDAQEVFFANTRALDAEFVYWLQDLLGIGTRAILRSKIPLLGELVSLYFLRLERSLLRKSDAVIPITKDFCPTLHSWGISGERIVVIPNWAPLGELPVHPRDNEWARHRGLTGGFNFLYTGTLRMKHNPSLLLELTKYLNHRRRDAKLVVTSEGPGANWLRLQAEKLGLQNVLVMGFQPMNVYSQVLASADVLLAILNKAAGAFSVPSKVLSYLCAERPLLLAVPRENHAAKIVEGTAAGIVAEPDDLEAFLQGARAMLASPGLRKKMGENARNYAEKTFDIHSIADRFEELILQL